MVVTRKIVVCILLLIGFIINGKGQCWEERKTISTFWESYTGSNEFPNDFDWTKEEFDIYLTGSNYLPGPEPVVSPFYVPSNTLYQDNVSHFQNFLDVSMKDFHPEDGWELLHKEFGHPGGPSNAVTYPFFILYNKYRGNIRVFLMIREKPEQYQKSAQIHIYFDDNSKKTAIFQHVRPESKSIANFKEDLEVETPNRFSNKDYYWLHSDIAMAYDPCTCNKNDISRFVIGFSLIDEASIGLSGKLEGQIWEEQVVVPHTGEVHPTEINVGPYSFAPKDAKKLYNNGQRYFKEFEGFGKNMDSWLNKQNTEYKNRVVSNWYSQKYGTIAPQATMNQAFSNTLKTAKGKEELFGVKLTDPIIDDVKTVTSIVPYAGYVWGLVDFLNTGGREEVEDKIVQKPPLSMKATLSLEGKITELNPIDFPIIYTPGTNEGNNPSIPKWNNILGVVNLLSPPSLVYDRYYPNVTHSETNESRVMTNMEVRQFRSEEELKIVFKPCI